MNVEELIEYVNNAEEFLTASQISELCNQHKIYGEDKFRVFEECYSDVISHKVAQHLRDKIIDKYAEFANQYDQHSSDDKNWLMECLLEVEPDYQNIVVATHNQYVDFFDFVEQKLISSSISWYNHEMRDFIPIS